MGGFFSLDGAFYKYGTILADILILTMLWIFFSIPIITMGAATTSVYYVTTRKVGHKEGYLFRDFWKSFRQNFFKATLMWIMIVIIIGLAIFNLLNIGSMGTLAAVFYPLEIVLIIEMVAISIYLFPMIARFEMNKRQLFKASFIMANRHLLTTITCLVLGVVTLLAIYQWFFLFFVGMGAYAYLTSMLLMKVFKKYRPEMDRNEQYDDIIESQNAQRAIESIRREQIEAWRSKRDDSEPAEQSSGNTDIIDEAIITDKDKLKEDF